ELATSMFLLAEDLRKQNKFAEAEPLFRESLGMRRRLLGNDHPDVCDSLDYLSLCLSSQKNPQLYPEAEALQRELMDIRRRLSDADREKTDSQGLGLVLLREGKYAEAEPELRAALADRRRQFGDDSPDVAYPLHNLADSLRLQKRNLSEAE